MNTLALTTPRLRSALWLALAACCSGQAAADGLTISPVVIEIESPRKVVAVTVTNNADEPATLQADTLVWRQVDGVENYTPTDELLVVPPIVKVPAHASQVFRVALRVPTDSAVERSYRLVLEDISEQTSAAGQTAIAFRFAHNLPVMVAPSAKRVSAVQWQPCAPKAMPKSMPRAPHNAATFAVAKPSDGALDACVRLHNAGNYRVKVQALTLTGDDWAHTLTLKDGVNVLVGAAYEWLVALPASDTGAVRGVQVDTARGETLQAESGGF